MLLNVRKTIFIVGVFIPSWAHTTAAVTWNRLTDTARTQAAGILPGTYPPVGAILRYGRTFSGFRLELKRDENLLQGADLVDSHAMVEIPPALALDDLSARVVLTRENGNIIIHHVTLAGDHDQREVKVRWKFLAQRASMRGQDLFVAGAFNKGWGLYRITSAAEAHKVFETDERQNLDRIIVTALVPAPGGGWLVGWSRLHPIQLGATTGSSRITHISDDGRQVGEFVAPGKFPVLTTGSDRIWAATDTSFAVFVRRLRLFELNFGLKKLSDHQTSRESKGFMGFHVALHQGQAVLAHHTDEALALSRRPASKGGSLETDHHPFQKLLQVWDARSTPAGLAVLCEAFEVDYVKNDLLQTIVMGIIP